MIGPNLNQLREMAKIKPESRKHLRGGALFEA